MFGAIATGVFATRAIQAAYTGPDRRQPRQVGIQLVAVAAHVAFAVVATFIIVKLVDVDPRAPRPGGEEEAGLDLAVHGEAAYQA